MCGGESSSKTDCRFFFRTHSPSSTPLKKLAEPSDVATQVLALASDTLSGHVTGQVMMVHGGMEGRLLNKEADIQ